MFCARVSLAAEGGTGEVGSAADLHGFVEQQHDKLKHSSNSQKANQAVVSLAGLCCCKMLLFNWW
jgi:hypothetical protein